MGGRVTACVHRCHQIDCDTDDCPGCRLAAPQSLVCHRCDRLTRQHQRDLPALYDDLTGAYAVRSGHALTGIGAGGHEPPMLVDDNRRQARSAIRALLVAWCLVLRDDWRITLPADTVPALTRHVATQTSRLLNHPAHADQLVTDLENAASTAWRLARPRARQPVRVPCPTCGERVALDVDPNDRTATIQCRGCDE